MTSVKCRSWIAGGSAVLLAFFTAACTVQSTRHGAPGVYEGTALDGPAADFRLVDQNGVEVALSDFLGRAVVLTFMDSQCQDVCPLTAVHLREAFQMLGDEAVSAVFVGVNVNVGASAVADVASATQKWQLDEIPTWHFLTGSADELTPVWEAYGVAVTRGEDEIQHAPGVFLIDQAGQKRWYVSTPFDEAGVPQGTARLSELLIKHVRELLSE